MNEKHMDKTIQALGQRIHANFEIIQIQGQLIDSLEKRLIVLEENK